MLIGAGFPSVVVSGVARADVIKNNQSKVPYPHEIVDININECEKEEVRRNQTYNLRAMPDLDSHLDEKMTKILEQKANEEQRIQDEIKKKELEVISYRFVLYYTNRYLFNTEIEAYSLFSDHRYCVFINK